MKFLYFRPCREPIKMEVSKEIPYKLKKIQAVVTSPTTTVGADDLMIILTHGAGGDMNTEQLCFVTKKLVDAGFKVLRFTCKPPNFSYRVKVFMAVLVCIE